MPMDKPTQPYPNAPTTTPSPMPGYLQDPSIRGVSFDQLLQNRGVRFVHKRAVPCPNVKSIDTNVHAPECAFCNDSGIMMYGEKEIWGTFYSNSMQKTFEMHGIWEIGQAMVTLPAEYGDGTQADFNTYDRLIIPDFTVRMWELKEYEPRVGNKQFLRYPVRNVDFASSVVAGVQKYYVRDVDFTLDTDGGIVWIAGREPGYDNVDERGEVIVWSYFANPEYVVMQTMHELRITQELTGVGGTKVARRLPQQVLVKRDFLVNPAEKISGI